ncbi:inducible metalloproteinase inhibitor protein-like [Pleurodeles waltl]|uniref:inducible metalloproteinase inhibitor protein-like n=1 Tax=Pleurodeles waltl TaxID=8319 RepID=UPI0037098239
MGNKDISLLPLIMGFALMLAYTQTTSICPANMHFDDCGSACPENCPQLGEVSVCTLQCKPKCVCNDGYILEDSKSTRCIPKSECSSCKQNNAVYTSCGTACPLNCQNYLHPPTKCTKECVTGCFCKKGFVFRSEKKGMCVKKSQCQKP